MKVYSGDLVPEDLMRLLNLFKNEKDTHVWIIILKNLHVLSKCLLNLPFFDDFKSFLADLLRNVKLSISLVIKPDEGYLFIKKI